MTAPEIAVVDEIDAEPTAAEPEAAEPTPQELAAVELLGLVQRIDKLEEDVERLGMYMHLGDEWGNAHLHAVTQLAQARTERAQIKRRWGI
ncbi:hypothetical protein [Nocardia wallacei]|uniref:hypothetical protein n=1 Tax=Nocardia wallacei TaxID=480035 RepID=UPI002454D007|nr:hypothetical protein [Nocardia wallacei]